MSGPFDFPQASASTNGASVPPRPSMNISIDSSVRLQQLQNSLRADRERERAERAAMDDEAVHRNAERRRRRLHEIGRLRAARDAPSTADRAQTSDPPIPAIRNRLQPTPRARHLHRSRQEQDSYHSSALAGLQQAGERLAEASSNLSSLLDQPIPRITSPDITTQEYSGEAELNRRRSKRRKLEGDGPPGDMQGFSYGHFGQVVPGRLKMEIVSCDGGSHIEQYSDSRDYGAENVLRNDQSVYCTKSNRCNLILSHIGETTFCLKKLVIKAPSGGFTAPVQEGMVFISMTLDELLPRTAQYQIHYSSSSPRNVSGSSAITGREDPRSVSSRVSLYPIPRAHPPRSSDVYPGTRPRREFYASWSPPYGLANPSAIPGNPNDVEELFIDAEVDSYINDHPSATTHLPSPPPFTVITDCDDKSGDEEDESSAAILTDRYRRDHLAVSYSSDDDDSGVSRSVNIHHRMVPPPSGIRRHRQRATPSRIELSTYTNSAHTQDGAAPATSEIMAPHARFFIQKERSMVSMKFDPPVSGRYILLKLWSPARDQNIDIQSIVVHGFAGPRFFPALDLM